MPRGISTPKEINEILNGPSDFDAMANLFTARVSAAANWKHRYFGAAYSTRIKQAIVELEAAIAEAKLHPEISQ